MISIHALLAESDVEEVSGDTWARDFYPRSPCGERHNSHFRYTSTFDFYPRSPCGERRALLAIHTKSRISIHALLAESDIFNTSCAKPIHIFLSTLSLRRATTNQTNTKPTKEISIHALLAESDEASTHQERQAQHISIHALLAESDQRQ